MVVEQLRDRGGERQILNEGHIMTRKSRSRARQRLSLAGSGAYRFAWIGNRRLLRPGKGLEL